MRILSITTIALAALVNTAFADDIRICVEGAYPPFSEVNTAGEVVGFDIDIAAALCSEMGHNCENVQTEWDGIIPALLEKKCDAIIASMSITEERKKQIDFSEKYYNSPNIFAAQEGVDWTDDNEGLKGKSVGVQRGTTHQEYMEAKFPDVELKLYGTQDEAYLDLQAGRIDAIMADVIAINDGFLATDSGKGFAQFGNIHLDEAIHGVGAGIGVRQEDTELRDSFSAAIQTIRDNGTYKSINDKYFSFDLYGD